MFASTGKDYGVDYNPPILGLVGKTKAEAKRIAQAKQRNRNLLDHMGTEGPVVQSSSSSSASESSDESVGKPHENLDRLPKWTDIENIMQTSA